MGRWHILGAGLLLTACGNEVRVLDDGSGGAAASSATTSAVSGTASGSTGGVGGTTPVDPCTSNDDCAFNSLCALPPGICDGGGVCEPRPLGCTADCPGVCGCDGETHCNACMAASVGVNVAHEGPCETPTDVVYVAQAVPGGLDHLFVRRADFTFDTCTVLHAAAPGGVPFYDLVVMPPFEVVTIAIGPGADACLDPAAPIPFGEQAIFATGVLDGIPGPSGLYPCELFMKFIVDFAAVPAGPTAVPFEGTIPVDGCF